MAIVVIGGHTRNIGKTSVVCKLVSAFADRQWTAVKITQFGHGVCSANGKPCDCETADHSMALSEERSADSGTDSSRYLSAGAARSLWVRTRQGELVEAMPRLRQEFSRPGNFIVESNSLLRFLQPDLYLAVLDPEVADFKGSALRYLDRADALLFSGRRNPRERSGWEAVSPGLIASVPAFGIEPPHYWSAALEGFVRAHLSAVDAAAAAAGD